MQDTKRQFVETNGIRLAYLDYPGGDQTLILSHGLTANASSFGGLIDAGLADGLRVIAVDLRGRGLSDKPATGYTMDDHAGDILGLMDAFGLDSAIVGGHSYGGLLTMYLAAHHPQRVQKMVIIDSGLMPDNVLDIIAPSLARLGKPVESWDAYRDRMKAAPYYHDGFWDPFLEAYYRADVEDRDDGSVIPRSTAEAIAEAAETGLSVDWPGTLAMAAQPAIMLHAPEPFGPPPNSLPVLTEAEAKATVNALPNCRYVAMPGNHLTMLFGKHAPGVVKTIRDFIADA